MYPTDHTPPTAPQLIKFLDLLMDMQWYSVDEVYALYIMQPTGRIADLKRHGYIIRRRKRYHFDANGKRIIPARTDYRLQPDGEGNHDFADVMTVDSPVVAQQRRNVPTNEEDLA